MFWWQKSNVTTVGQYDYPISRVNAAEKLAHQAAGFFEKTVRQIGSASSTKEQAVRGITIYVQQSVIHNPIFQPARSYALYPLLKLLHRHKLISETRFHYANSILGASLITDPDLLLQLGEARCGQCAIMLKIGFNMLGLRSQIMQLNNHIVAEVELDGVSYIIDADAFKNGIMFELNGRLISTKDIWANPYLVDQFKPTGWMFRRDSVYALNQRTLKPYRGYIDLYSPEIDGQISSSYNAPKCLYPPGIPKWATEPPTLRLEAEEKKSFTFDVSYADRAVGYKVRCGRQSRGYSYDGLVYANLGRETSNEVFEISTTDNRLEISFEKPGTYYLTVASIPHYIEEFPSYIWWSDELKVEVG